MAITTLHSEQPFPHVCLSLLRITEPGADPHEGWEVQCDNCRGMDVLLTRDEADESVEAHAACTPKEDA